MSRGEEERVNRLVAETSLLLPGELRPISGRGYSATAPDGILQMRERLAPVLGISRQSLWRYAVSGAPAWLVFALLGVAVTRGDRKKALRELEKHFSE